MSDLPKVTFGIIVFNGEPFTRYCLRAIYPFAHEIIVVEGAVKSAASLATPDGHSTDGTLDTLYRFKEGEDPENKLQIVTRNGFWEEKDEQSRAYVERATGEYLWQVDIDEFYHPHDMQLVLEMLRNDPEITAVSFKQITFWGGFDYVVDSWYLRRGAEVFHRLFKWGKGYRYVTHRPPTIHDAYGRDLRHLKWVYTELKKRGIFLYHYSLVFPKQVREKCDYYSQANWARHAKGAREWAEFNFFKLTNPYRVHNVYQYPSWLKRFEGKHPPAIRQMQDDILSGCLQVEMRDNRDIEALLKSWRYRLGAKLLIGIDPLDRIWSNVIYWSNRIKHKMAEKIKKL